MANKEKLKKILASISRPDVRDAFKSVEKEMQRVADKLKEDAEAKTVELAKKRIAEVKDQIQSIFKSLENLKENLKKSEGDLTSSLNQSLNALKSKMAEYRTAGLDELGNLSTEIDSLKDDIKEISQRKVELPNYQNQISEIENTLGQLIGGLKEETEIKIDDILSESKKAVNALQAEIKKLRSDTMSAIVGRGGGNMNRNILINDNPSVLGRYTDLNIKSGTDITLNYVNNDSLKTTDLTIGFTGASGVVTSVSNSDGTLTISPTTGDAVASLALGKANTWTGQQTFSTSAPIFSTMTSGSVLFAGASGVLSQDNANLFWDDTNNRFGLGTATPSYPLDIRTAMTGSGGLAYGVNMQQTLTAGANSDTLYGLYVNTTFAANSKTLLTSSLLQIPANTLAGSGFNTFGIRIANGSGGNFVDGTSGGYEGIEVGSITQTNGSSTHGIVINQVTGTNVTGLTGMNIVGAINTGATTYGILIGSGTTTKSVSAGTTAVALALYQPFINTEIAGTTHLVGIDVLANTVSNNAGDTAGTTTNAYGMRIAQQTYTASAARTITNAASLYIAGQPVAGSNVTITNNAALVVASGIVGIGIANPNVNTSLQVFGTKTASTGTGTVIVVNGTITTSAQQAIGIDISPTLVIDTTTVNNILLRTNGTIDPQADFSASANVVFAINNNMTIGGTSANGINNVSLNGGTLSKGGTYTGTITTVSQFLVNNPSGFSAGQIGTFRGLRVAAITNGNGVTSGTVTNSGMSIGAFTATSGVGGTVNNFGIDIALPSGTNSGTNTNKGISITGNGQTGGTTTNWAIFASSTANSTILGNLSVGTNTAPTAKIMLGAGTASASTAPLKFISGTLLTTPEAGAVEFLTDAFYGTITTGAARQRFVTGTKRITSTASSATPTPNADTDDIFILTAQAAAAAFAAPTGTPTQGQSLVIRIKDDATARALTWNAIYRAGTDVALPTTTTISKTLYVGFIYNSTDTKWDLLAKTNGY